MNANFNTINNNNLPVDPPSVTLATEPSSMTSSVSAKLHSANSLPHAGLTSKKMTLLKREQLQKELILYAQCQSPAMGGFFGFFKTLMSRIVNLFSFLKIKPPESINPQILAQLVRGLPDSATCPSSVIVDYVKSYLEKNEENLNQEEQKLYQNLIIASKWAKQLEHLKTLPKLNPQSKQLTSLIGDMTTQLAKLEKHQKLLVPGGYQKEPNQFVEAFYEIEKTADDDFTVRVVCLDADLKPYWPRREKNKVHYNPVLEFTQVTQTQLISSLAPLVTIQLPQIYTADAKQQSNLLKLMKHFKKKVTQNKADQKETTLTCLTVMTTLYGQSPQPSLNAATFINERSQTTKTLLTYLKVRQPKSYKQAKIELELSSFFDFINKDSQALFKSKQLRQLTYASARKLIYELEKHQTNLAFDEQKFETIIQDLNDLLSLIQRLDLQEINKSFPVIHLAKFNEKISLPPLNYAQNSTNFSSSSSPSVAQAPAFVDLNIPTLRSQDKKIDLAAFKQATHLFNQQIQVAKALYRDKEYAMLETFTLNLIRQLPIPKAIKEGETGGDFWEGLLDLCTATQEMTVLDQWNDNVVELSQFLLDAQLLQTTPITSEKTLSHATLLVIADKLMVLKNRFEKNDLYYSVQEKKGPKKKQQEKVQLEKLVCIDHSGLAKLLQSDAYFRAIPAYQHAKLRHILTYWEATKDSRIFIDIADSVCVSTDSVNYFKKCYLSKHPSHPLDSHLKATQLYSKEIEYEASHSFILPKEVIQQKKMYLSLQVAIRENCLDQLNLTNLIRTRTISSSKQQIQAYLRTHPPTLKHGQRQHIQFNFSKQNFNFGSSTCFHLKNSNVYFYHQADLGYYSYRRQGRYIEKPTVLSQIDLVKFKLNDYRGYSAVTKLQQEINAAKHLSPEQKLLACMQSKGSRLEQTLATFAAHPELFDHSSNQRLFELNIFGQKTAKSPKQDTTLLTKLNNQPDFATQVLSFIEDNIDLAIGTSNIPRALFLISLRENLKDYVQLADIADETKKNILAKFNSPPRYASLLNICTTALQKRDIYFEQALYFSTQMDQDHLNFDQLTDEKIKILGDILKGYFLVKSLASGQPTNLDAERQFEQLLLRLRPHLQAILPANQAASQLLMAGIAEVLDLPHQTGTLTGQFPYLKLGKSVFHFDKGLVLENDQAKTLLPPSILEDETVIRLFQHPKTKAFSFGQVYLQLKIDPKTAQEMVIYTFENLPDVRFIQQKEKPLSIQTKFYASPKPGLLAQKNWYEYVPFDPAIKSTCPFPHEIGNLLTHHCTWRCLKDPSQLIVKDETNQTHLYAIHLHTFKGQWQIDRVKRFKDDLQLVNPWQKQPQLGDFTQIEDPRHIKVWAKVGTLGTEIKEIEFSRLKQANGETLVYAIHQIGQECVITNRAGAVLTFESGPLIEKSLPSKEGLDRELLPHPFEQFHLLKHPKTGLESLLIPFQPFKTTPLPSELAKEKALDSYQGGWSDQVWLEHQPDSWETQRVLEFKINPHTQRLEAPNQEGSLYLAYLFLTHKRYEKALEYLQASQTSLTLSPSHQALYQWLIEWPDQTAEGQAFKLRVHLALKACRENDQLAGSTTQEGLAHEQMMQDLVHAYQQQEQELPSPLKLSAVEKSRCLSSVANSLTESTKKTKHTLPQPWIHPKKAFVPLAATILAQAVFIQMQQKKVPFDHFYLRSDLLFLTYFQDLYQKICSLDPISKEFQQYKQLITLAAPVDPAAQNIQYLLRAVILKKEHFQQEEGKKFSFPQLNLSYFTVRRLSVANSQHPEVKKLEKFLENLKKLADQVTELTPSNLANDQPELIQNSIQKSQNSMQKFLEEANSLESSSDVDSEIDHEIQADTHSKFLETFMDQSKDSIPYLKPLSSVPAIKEQENEEVQDSFAATPVFALDRALFFDVTATHSSAKERKKSLAELTTFFKPYQQETTAPHVQRLTQNYQADALAYLEQEQPPEISLKGPIQALDERISLDLQSMTKCKVQAEAAVLDLLNRHRPFSSYLAERQSFMPKRLIGLYAEGQLAQAPLIFGLKFKDQLEETEWLEKIESCLQTALVTTIQERTLTQALEAVRHLPVVPSQEELAQLYRLLPPMRFFDLDNHPDAKLFLIIEYLTGFILRKSQLETLAIMLKDPTQVKQLGMGEGKSSIILPLLLHKLADGQQLAIGILPEWLYQIVATDLDKNSRALFGQAIFKFEFDRHFPLNQEWLLKQESMLIQAIKNQDALITTKNCMLSFRNKFLELYQELERAEGEKLASLQANLKIMGRILHLFATRGAVIADEVDGILSIRQELNYALGEAQVLETNKWQLGLCLYKKILTDPALKKYGKAVRRNEQHALAPKQIAQLQKKLATSFYADWKTQLEEVHVSLPEFSDYLLSTQLLKEELTPSTLPSFMEKLEQQNLALYQDIALLRHYLSQTLPTTLSHAGNVHYGRAAEGTQTIPYKANNTPSEAEFGEEFERICYFIQDYLQQGLSQAQVHTWVNTLLNQISHEMHQTLALTDKMGNYEEMATYRAFKQDFPSFDLLQVSRDPVYFQALYQEINTQEAQKLQFLSTWVFPSLQVATQQISSNAHDLVTLFKSFSGFTGTPWNIDTYHQAIHTNGVQTEGTEGKTIHLLMELFKRQALTIHTFKLAAEHPLESLMTYCPDFVETYDALIDAGYYLKGLEPEAVVEGLAQANKSKKRAIVYINTNNEKRIQPLDQGASYLLENRPDIKMEERLTYFDQAHAIGTDIPHATQARAALTISERMYLKDLFQALWRMRKIDQSQKVDFFISTEVATLIRAARPANFVPTNEDALTIQDIILFCIKNQAEREAEDNLRAERQRLISTVPHSLFNQLIAACEKGDVTTQQQLIQHYRPFLFKTIANDYTSLAQINSLDETHAVLERLRQQLLTEYSTLEANLKLNSDEEQYRKELRLAIERLEKHLLLAKEKLPVQTENLPQGAKELQVQTERQQQQQMKLQLQQVPAPSTFEGIREIWEANGLDTLWEHEIFSKQPPLSRAIPFLDKQIQCTSNFNLVNISQPKTLFAKRLLDPHRLPVAQVLVMQNKRQEWKLVLLDIKDYEDSVLRCIQDFKAQKKDIKNKRSSRDEIKVAVFDVRPLKGCWLLTSHMDENKNPWIGQEYRGLLKKLIKIKLFNKQMNFHSKEELSLLKEIIEEDQDKEIQRYFETHVVTEATEATYATSTLYQLFYPT